MCATFCHFAKQSRGNRVASFVLSVFESEIAGILCIALLFPVKFVAGGQPPPMPVFDTSSGLPAGADLGGDLKDLHGRRLIPGRLGDPYSLDGRYSIRDAIVLVIPIDQCLPPDRVSNIFAS